MSEHNFLSRWSRRKLEGEAAAPKPESAPPTPQPEPALPIPELPPIDSLTAASDFKPFLQAGVPDSLKRAALRRLWALDPEIRDFIGPARDYGWDWNAPGGVPGGGELPPADEIARMVERVFGTDSPAQKPAPESPKATEPPAPLQPAPQVAETQGEILPSSNNSEPAAAARRRHGKATPA